MGLHRQDLRVQEDRAHGQEQIQVPPNQVQEVVQGVKVQVREGLAYRDQSIPN